MVKKYCHQHGRMTPCVVCDESNLLEGIKVSDRRIKELEEKLSAAESRVAELENVPDWVKVGDGTLHGAIDHWQEKCSELERQNAELVKPDCLWSADTSYAESDSGTWEGSCGVTWYFTDGGPEDNEVNYCPRCGGKLIVNETGNG